MRTLVLAGRFFGQQKGPGMCPGLENLFCMPNLDFYDSYLVSMLCDNADQVNGLHPYSSGIIVGMDADQFRESGVQI